MSGFNFPFHDVMWEETANFINAHLDQNDTIAGPSEFNETVGPIYTDTIIKYNNGLLFVGSRPIEIDWFILHKGKINNVDLPLLIKLCMSYDPVFANGVFVIFAKKGKSLEIIDKDSDHYKAFVNKVIEIIINKKDETIKTEDKIKIDDSKNNREYMYLGDYKALTRTIYGHKMFLDTRDISLTPHIILDGYWEIWVTKVVTSLIKEGNNIVEIGCNVGYYSVIFASKIGKSGKIFAFEANSQVFEILHQNIEINGFFDRTILENRAVIDKLGKVSFNILRRHHGSSSIAKCSDKFLEMYRDSVEMIEVDTVSLDEYFKDKNIKIDIIKIDAEGSEPYIFDGMKKLLGDNPDIIIICEFIPYLISDAKRDPRKFLEEIKLHGFSLKYIDDKSGDIIDASIDELLQKDLCELYLKR